MSVVRITIRLMRRYQLYSSLSLRLLFSACLCFHPSSPRMDGRTRDGRESGQMDWWAKEPTGVQKMNQMVGIPTTIYNRTSPQPQNKWPVSTVCGHRLAHRKWKEIKQQPSMLPGPALSGCMQLSFSPFPVGHPMSADCTKLPNYTSRISHV